MFGQPWSKKLQKLYELNSLSQFLFRPGYLKNVKELWIMDKFKSLKEIPIGSVDL